MPNDNNNAIKSQTQTRTLYDSKNGGIKYYAQITADDEMNYDNNDILSSCFNVSPCSPSSQKHVSIKSTSMNENKHFTVEFDGMLTMIDSDDNNNYHDRDKKMPVVDGEVIFNDRT